MGISPHHRAMRACVGPRRIGINFCTGLELTITLLGIQQEQTSLCPSVAFGQSLLPPVQEPDSLELQIHGKELQDWQIDEAEQLQVS